MRPVLRLAVLALACAVLPLTTAGCGSTVADWIVRTRNHQGDIALERKKWGAFFLLVAFLFLYMGWSSLAR